MAGTLDRLLKVIAPKRFQGGGNATTNTFAADRTNQVLSAPTYREHLTDLFSSRQSQDSKALLQELFIHDTDVSAAVNAYLTVADTDVVMTVRDADGKFDRQGMKDLNTIIATITQRFDYSKGFVWKQSLRALAESMRYMILLRGAIAEELVFDKTQTPSEIRHIDPATLQWFEVAPNQFKPQQKSPTTGDDISLDVPTFFFSTFRRDPTRIYTHSPFVSAINTVAARQQVINDLYRIMQLTGFPRIDVKVMEEVILKNAPASIMQDGAKQRAYVEGEISKITAQMSSMRADQPIAHTDAVEVKVFNEKNPSNGLDISSVIGALNAMNQAGLRTMATILGRGESGVNTASVEARIFSMNAEAINVPIAELLSQMLTMALRAVAKSESRVDVKFRPVELRPLTELEPQLTMRAARLKEDLSLGIIDDDEYHLEMYGRLRPDSAPELSGTGFMNQGSVGVDASNVSPNSDPLGRSITPDGGDKAKGSDVTKKDPNKKQQK